MARLRLVLVNILVLVLMYVAAELSFSTYRYVFPRPPSSYWLYEHFGETYHFDPSAGVFLTRVPSRYARITYGQVEYVGTIRGNNHGFPDRDDFTPARSSANQKRFAVFGDSFTAAQYISLSWPGRVEDIYAKRHSSLQLLNFSFDGVGLANWASIIRNTLAIDHYQLDGLIFAVWMTDLDRRFTFFVQTDQPTIAIGHASTWDIPGQPKTLSDARKIAVPGEYAYIVSSAEFDAALSGRWRPPRKWRYQGSVHLSNFVRAISNLLGLASQDPIGSKTFEPGQLAVTAEIKEFAQQRSLPVLVVYIPSRDELLQPGQPSPLEKVKRFSQILGATFLDGRAAFAGLNKQQIKACWMTYDWHWNQAGSDRFAEFMAQELQAWPGPSGH